MAGWPGTATAGWPHCRQSRSLDGRQPCPVHSLGRLYGLVVGNDPRQLRFAVALWTRAMLRELIRREFDVRLSEVSVGPLLRKLELSPQRPLYRAYQQNPRRWRAGRPRPTASSAPRPPRRAPPSTSRMKPGYARITSRDDLGAGRPDPGGGDHRRPVRGQPDLGGDRQGQAALCRLRGQSERPSVIDFCRRLLHDTPGPVFLVLDGHPVHRSKVVKAFAASTDGRLRLCFLPGYAPQLNPMSGCGSTSSTTGSAGPV